MNKTLKYAILFAALVLLIFYIALGQVISTHTRRAEFLKLDWATSWHAPNTLMGQMPGFPSGPFVFVEHVDVEVTDDGTIYAANNLLRRLNPGGGIAWESSVVLDEDVVASAIYFRDVCVDDTGDIYGLGHLRYARESWPSTVGEEFQVMTMFLTKQDLDGSLEWQKIWDDDITGRVWGINVLPDPDGNPVIIGNCEISMDLDPGDDVTSYINESNPKLGLDPQEILEIDDYDCFAIKLSGEDGSFMASFVWSGTMYSAIPWGDDGIIFSSNQVETDQIEELGLTGRIIQPHSVFVELDWDLENFEVITLPRDQNSVLYRTLATDHVGNLVAAGTFNVDDGVWCEFSIFTPDFELIQSHRFGQTKNEIYPLDIAISPSGDIFAAGGFASTTEYRRRSIDFDPGRNKDLHAGPLYEIFITKYSSDGEYRWTGSFGGERNDWAGGIAIDNDGKILVLGYFQNHVDFDPSPEDMLQSTQSDIGEFLAQFTEWPG